jgi:hypothetical protein
VIVTSSSRAFDGIASVYVVSSPPVAVIVPPRVAEIVTVAACGVSRVDCPETGCGLVGSETPVAVGFGVAVAVLFTVWQTLTFFGFP